MFVPSLVDDASLYDDRTRRWMCCVRPSFQPGTIVANVTEPVASVSR